MYSYTTRNLPNSFILYQAVSFSRFHTPSEVASTSLRMRAFYMLEILAAPCSTAHVGFHPIKNIPTINQALRIAPSHQLIARAGKMQVRYFGDVPIPPRSRAISLFRGLLRRAKTLPTAERRSWLRKDVVNTFRDNSSNVSPDEIDKLLKRGNTLVELLSLRPQALSLYRRLIRAASHMPTRNRAEFVRRKARSEVRYNPDQQLTSSRQGAK